MAEIRETKDNRIGGFFLTIEGIDGAGKTTLNQELRNMLIKNGKPAHLTFEPTPSKIGNLVKEALYKDKVNYKTQIFLLLADMNEHCVKYIKPILERGEIVLCDRFYHSTFAYQGVMSKDKLNWLKPLLQKHLLKPDLTILLDLPVELALKRLSLRNQLNNSFSSLYETEDYLKRVRANYEDMLHKDSDKIVKLDAKQTTKQVVWQAYELLMQKISSKNSFLNALETENTN